MLCQALWLVLGVSRTSAPFKVQPVLLQIDSFEAALGEPTALATGPPIPLASLDTADQQLRSCQMRAVKAEAQVISLQLRLTEAGTNQKSQYDFLLAAVDRLPSNHRMPFLCIIFGLGLAGYIYVKYMSRQQAPCVLRNAMRDLCRWPSRLRGDRHRPGAVLDEHAAASRASPCGHRGDADAMGAAGSTAAGSIAAGGTAARGAGPTTHMAFASASVALACRVASSSQKS